MVSAASAYASGEDSNGSISMVPSSLNFTATHVGQTLNLTVWVNDSSNVGAWQVRVEFDDSVINLTDCKELENDSQYIFAGKTTNAWGVTPDVIYVHDASGKGHVLVAAALVPTPPAQQPSSGTGTLCALTFEILSLPQVGQQLTLPLHINTTDTYLLDSNGAEIENVTIYDGTVQIESRALGIQLLSPENETYSTNSVIVNFTIGGQTSWIGYSLDGQANVTITGNTTIPGLPEGTHNIVVYANDTAGNAGASDKVWFSIQASSLPFLIWTFGTIAIVAFVVLGISYYFVRKRKRHVS